ncbi:DEK domain-containing chromatin-associated protein 1-like [Andrographis paniculata]|uniref:DEK domain-containing chromatin-associated protein 1-like n=1 Tax=Andrographis paniculata TaxID=175694 RepID=UPI0021E78993|nr:DEK domain-containing chromatin-associated protein 1-like [Andrographis paniculata]
MASEKETMEGSEKQEGEKGKDPTEVAGKGEVAEVEGDKREEDEGSEKVDGDEEMEEAGKEGDEIGEEREEEGKGGKDEDEEEEDEAKGGNKGKRIGKRGSRGKKTSEAGDLSSPRTPGSERPTRERKTVERFMVTDTPRVSAAKPLSIEKGQGTQFKDIPNVAFKLSKRKADENLQLLHTILFGKKAKAHSLKKNIGLFSGFVWTDNEEKQKAKVKEKLDKCVKEKLLDFCDILNISVNKASTRKEELSAKLFEFLESPHATTDILLAEKENAKKRKSKGSARKSQGSRKSTKKQKVDSDSAKRRKESAAEDDGKSEPSENEDDQDEAAPAAESDAEENVSEEETNDDQDEEEKQNVVEKGSAKQSAIKDTRSSGGKSKTSDKPVGKSSSSKSKKQTAEAESEKNTKPRVTKKQKAEKDASPPGKTASPSKKRSSRSSKKATEKDEDEDSEIAVKEPTREEMHAVVVNMLKQVDFNKATLSDILKQLGAHFEVDLIHRKAEVKDIITEVIQNMSDDEDDEDESGDEDEPGKDAGDD